MKVEDRTLAAWQEVPGTRAWYVEDDAGRRAGLILLERISGEELGHIWRGITGLWAAVRVDRRSATAPFPMPIRWRPSRREAVEYLAAGGPC